MIVNENIFAHMDKYTVRKNEEKTTLVLMWKYIMFIINGISDDYRFNVKYKIQFKKI